MDINLVKYVINGTNFIYYVYLELSQTQRKRAESSAAEVKDAQEIHRSKDKETGKQLLIILTERTARIER